MKNDLATMCSASRRSFVAMILLVMASGCAGATASPPATPGPAPAEPTTVEPVPEAMTGGRYDFRPLPDEPSFSVVATGPDGWFGYPSWAMDGPLPVRADAPTGIGISFFTANGLYSDPCRWDVQGTGFADVGDVEVGPTVDDLVVKIEGYSGQELELQLPNDPLTNCDKEPGDTDGHAFVFSGAGLYAQGPANRWHLYILDVDGTRLIAVILSYRRTPETDLDLARDIIETLDIDP